MRETIRSVKKRQTTEEIRNHSKNVGYDIVCHTWIFFLCFLFLPWVSESPPNDHVKNSEKVLNK